MVGLGLGLGLGFGNNRGTSSKGPICDAIARKVCISATHKKKALILAPHVAYNAPSGQTMDGVVIEQNGKAPNKPKLEPFLVQDLESVAVTDRTFTPDPRFNPDDPEYAGKVVCVIQMV